MKRIILAVSLFVASSGCTAIHINTSRTNFDQNARLKAACAEYANTKEMNQGVALAAEAGWRVAEAGSRSTSFLIFSSHRAVLCFEKRIEKPGDETATLPMPVKPKPPPSHDAHDDDQDQQDDR